MLDIEISWFISAISKVKGFQLGIVFLEESYLSCHKCERARTFNCDSFRVETMYSSAPVTDHIFRTPYLHQFLELGLSPLIAILSFDANSQNIPALLRVHFRSRLWSVMRGQLRHYCKFAVYNFTCFVITSARIYLVASLEKLRKIFIQFSGQLGYVSLPAPS